MNKFKQMNLQAAPEKILIFNSNIFIQFRCFSIISQLKSNKYARHSNAFFWIILKLLIEFKSYFNHFLSWKKVGGFRHLNRTFNVVHNKAIIGCFYKFIKMNQIFKKSIILFTKLNITPIARIFFVYLVPCLRCL